MNELSMEGARLLAYLVTRLPQAVPNNPKTFVSYKDVHDALGLPVQGPYGVSLKGQGLLSLAEWTVETGKPGITGLIIDRQTLEPGEGYFKLYPPSDNPYQRWADEISKSKDFDWGPYLDSGASAAARDVLPLEYPEPVAVGYSHIWRLVAHHDRANDAVKAMVERGVLAIGWTDTGSLDVLAPEDQGDISRRISEVYPDLKNANLGGPSLWNLLFEMQIGDLVILTANTRRKVVLEVVGEYFFASDEVLGYRHQRAAVCTGIDADALWKSSGGNIAEGQNVHWTLARLTPSADSRAIAYREGARFQISSTAIERNPAAREACIKHYGATCFVCKFDFEATYGAIGEGYIHVHHRNDLALSKGSYNVDPIRDLVPLCPNCHAMVHRERPALDVTQLKTRLITSRER